MKDPKARPKDSPKFRQKMLKAIGKGEQFEYIISDTTDETVTVDDNAITFSLSDMYQIKDLETARDFIAMISMWASRRDMMVRNRKKIG